jgi:hypothetical protein
LKSFSKIGIVKNKQEAVMIKDGFYKSLSLTDYLAEDALSKGGLSDLSISAAHYKARRVEAPTFPAAALGSAVHMLVLEPERAEVSIFTPPGDVLGKGGSKSTTAYKEWVTAQQPGALILSREDFERAHYMRDAVLAHPVAAELLSGGNPEVSMFWTDGNGVRRKCRPDYLSGVYVDLKTAISAKPDVFGKQAFNLHYHWSAAWTIDVGLGLGSSVDKYLFVAVEKDSPWAVCVFDTPLELIDMARSEIAPVYHLYKACKEFETWPGYSSEVEPLTFPRWAYKKGD